MLTLPNILTLSRIVTVPLLAAFLWWPQWQLGYFIAWAIYCLMGITDYFDGYLARSQGTVSKLGVFLDPIADKIMVAAVLLILAGRGVIAELNLIPALVILVREITVSGLREFLGGIQVSVPVSRLAKWKTTLQLLAMGGLILSRAVPDFTLLWQASVIAFWGAAVLTVITGWDYMRVGLKHMDT